jgi:ectoine hydroxylase
MNASVEPAREQTFPGDAERGLAVREAADVAGNVALFKQQGFVLLRGALSADEVDHYKAAMERVARKAKTYLEGGYLRESNLLEQDIVLSELLDHPVTYPYVRALLGPDFRIMSTEAIIRPQVGDEAVRWHEDGPNAPPYRALATPPPLCQLKVGYFLSDLPTDRNGNLVVVPGSHLLADKPPPTLPQGLNAPGAVSLKVRAGDAIVFHNALWHCVQPNETDNPRYNLYYAYCYPWMAPFDRSASSLVLRSLLTGERRRLLMDFEQPSRNYTLLRITWAGNPGAALLAPLRILAELTVKRLKVIKRKLLGG